MNDKHRRQFGGALPKILLLILMLGLLIGLYSWKHNYGVIGSEQPLPETTADRIAFIRLDGKQTSLVLAKADGSGENMLVSDDKNKISLCWSPDGRQICYSAEVAEEKGRANQLFIHGGGGSRQLTQGTVGKDTPQWRPNGKQIAFLTGGSIKIVDTNGDGMEQIYPSPHKGGGEESASEGDEDNPLKSPPIQSFRWSPDGANIAAIQITEGEQAAVIGQSKWWDKKDSANQDSNAMVMEPETLILLQGLTTKPQYIPGTNCKELSFDWFGDSKQLIVGINHRAGRHGIGVFRTDDVRLASTGVMDSAGYSVAPKNIVLSPDGKQIAFELYRMTSAEDSSLLGIAVISSDTGKPTLIRSEADMSKINLVVKGDAHRPQWSPDGKRLLYNMPNATKSGNDIWVVNADGTHPVNITNGKGDNIEAAWSPAKS